MDHISDTPVDQAIDLPAGVHIVARAECLEPLGALGEQARLVPCRIEDPLPVGELAFASIVVIEVDPGSRNSLERIERLRSEMPNVPVIAGLGDVDIATSRQLLRRGVRDIVALPFTLDELVTAIADASAAVSPETLADVPLAPFIAMLKSIGGSGTTTIATHLARSLAEDFGEDARACIIDLDLQSGDAAAFLGCSPRLTLADLLEADERLDEDLIRSVAVTGSGGVDVIAAPADIQPIEAVDFDTLMKVITAARREYDLVLLDLPASFTNWSLSTVFAADLTIMVGTLTIPSLRHAKRQLDFLVSMGISRETIQIVLNRVEKRLFKAIDAGDAAEALKHPILATVCEDTNLLRDAQDQGELVERLQKRSKFSKDIATLSDLIADILDEET